MTKENMNDEYMSKEITREERIKRAQEARKRMEARADENDYCDRCSPAEKEKKGVHIVGKGLLCPHGKKFAPKV